MVLSELHNTVTLQVMVRDRLVCGINDHQTQKKLLAEKLLSAVAVESVTMGCKRHHFRNV